MEELDDIRKGALYALKSLGQTPAESAVFLNTSVASIMQLWDSIDDVGHIVRQAEEFSGNDPVSCKWTAPRETPVLPIALSDALAFANPKTHVLVELAECSERWMQAIVLTRDFWESGYILPPTVNITAAISPLALASIRFDPHRPVRIEHTIGECINTATRAQVARLRCAVIDVQSTLPYLMEMMPALSEAVLNCDGCSDGTVLHSLCGLAFMEKLTMLGVDHVEDYSFLSSLQSLRDIRIEICTLKNLDSMIMLTNLQVLDISLASNLDDVTALGSLSSLKELYLDYCKRLKDISALASLRSLRVLCVIQCPVRSIACLSSLRALEELSLRGCRKLSDLTSLVPLASLKELDLGGWVKLEDITALSSLRSLEMLSLDGCPVRDLTALGSLVLLRCLNLGKYSDDTRRGTVEYCCRNITDVSPLASLVNMEELRLRGCVGLTDASPIQSLKSLKVLELSECLGLANISFVASLPHLKALTLTGSQRAEESPGVKSLDKVVLRRGYSF